MINDLCPGLQLTAKATIPWLAADNLEIGDDIRKMIYDGQKYSIGFVSMSEIGTSQKYRRFRISKLE